MISVGVGDEFGAQIADAPVGGAVFFVDGERLVEQRPARIARVQPLDQVTHAPDRPEQIDGGRTRGGQSLQIGLDRLLPVRARIGVSLASGQRHAIGRRHADCRRAAHHHVANGRGNLGGPVIAQELGTLGQNALIGQIEPTIVPERGVVRASAWWVAWFSSKAPLWHVERLLSTHSIPAYQRTARCTPNCSSMPSGS
jgi:hypothetical protein